MKDEAKFLDAFGAIVVLGVFAGFGVTATVGWSWLSDWKELLNGSIKAIAGPFVGAALAFYSNHWFQKRQRQNKNLAAGNMALAILSRQYGDFIVFRASIQQEIENKIDWPWWMKMPPTLLHFSESLRFDLPSLTFLSEGTHHDVLSKLLMADLSYHDLREILIKSSTACELRDEALASPGMSISDEDSASLLVDMSLRGKCGSYAQALVNRAQSDARVYLNAGEALYNVMLESFDAEFIMPFTALGAIEGIEDHAWWDAQEFPFHSRTFPQNRDDGLNTDSSK